MSESKPIIAVVLATSKQGYGLCVHLHDSGLYHVRGLTRNPASSLAQMLAKKGIEVIACEITRKEDLIQAFTGAYGVFAATPVYPPEQAEEEIRLGKLQGDAAIESKVTHLIWSGLEDVEGISKGEFKVEHFTGKAKVENYLRKLQFPTFSAAYLSFFYTNLIEYYPPIKLEDGTLEFRMPASGDFPYPFNDPLTSVGPIVLTMLTDPTKYNGKVIPVIGEEISFNRMAETFSEVTGIPAKYRAESKEEWLNDQRVKMKTPSYKLEMFEMFEFCTKYGYFRRDRDWKESRRIDPNTRTYGQFLKETKWRGESFEEWKTKNLLM